MKVEMKISPEARTRYLQRREQEVFDCRAALKINDFKFIERVGHTIKGNAETFGFADLATLGTRLEKVALAQESSNVSLVLIEIENYLKKYS